eukprot:9002-Pelagomonas_calceolata.AAC.1
MVKAATGHSSHALQANISPSLPHTPGNCNECSGRPQSSNSQQGSSEDEDREVGRDEDGGLQALQKVYLPTVAKKSVMTWFIRHHLPFPSSTAHAFRYFKNAGQVGGKKNAARGKLAEAAGRLTEHLALVSPPEHMLICLKNSCTCTF